MKLLITLTSLFLAACFSLAAQTNQINTNKVTLAWESFEGTEAIFNIYYGTITNAITNVSSLNITRPNTNSTFMLTITNLASDTQYYFKANAVSTNGLVGDFTPLLGYRTPFVKKDVLITLRIQVDSFPTLTSPHVVVTNFALFTLTNPPNTNFYSGKLFMTITNQ